MKKPLLNESELEAIEEFCSVNTLNKEDVVINLKIAKFMGAEVSYPTDKKRHIIVEWDWESNTQPCESGTHETSFVNSVIRLKYQESWQWLMPVLHQIAGNQ